MQGDDQLFSYSLEYVLTATGFQVVAEKRAICHKIRRSGRPDFAAFDSHQDAGITMGQI
jgi:hypothetical protein